MVSWSDRPIICYKPRNLSIPYFMQTYMSILVLYGLTKNKRCTSDDSAQRKYFLQRVFGKRGKAVRPHGFSSQFCGGITRPLSSSAPWTGFSQTELLHAVAKGVSCDPEHPGRPHLVTLRRRQRFLDEVALHLFERHLTSLRR